MSYVPKVYRKRGGTEQVVASGGTITVESGGIINVKTGGLLKNNGAAMDLSAGIATATAAIEAELNVLAGVTPGTVIASKAYVADANIDVTGGRNLTVTGTVTAPTVAATTAITATRTETSATPATTRLIHAQLTVTPETSAAIGSNGSLAAVRGLVTLSSGKSITDGFLFGTQGKLVLDGATVNVGSDHIAGVYAQMSASGATFTSGHIAPLISCGQSLPAGIADMIYCENNDVTKLHAVIEAVANADFVFDCTSEDGNSAYLVGTAGSSASKYMRIKLSGTEYRIALLAAA